MSDLTSPDTYSINASDAQSEQSSALPSNEWRYEATVKKIEAAIAQIESGELDLADVFDQFSAAIEDLRRCETFLSDRQQQVDLLIETLSDQSEF